jgi:hypothetical protein
MADEHQAADEPGVVTERRGHDSNPRGRAPERAARHRLAGRLEPALALPARQTPADHDQLRVEDVDEPDGGGEGAARVRQDRGGDGVPPQGSRPSARAS